MEFEIVSQITDVQTIAKGPGVRDRARLRNATETRDGASLRELPKCGFLMVRYD